MKILGHLGDAVITLGLYISTLVGVDLRFILSAILLLTFLGELAKAFNAFVEPIHDALQRIKAREPTKVHLTASGAIELLNGCHTNDVERDHLKADDILCDLLRSLGYEDVVQAYLNVEKWYA
jgi:hypothetical protein